MSRDEIACGFGLTRHRLISLVRLVVPNSFNISKLCITEDAYFSKTSIQSYSPQVWVSNSMPSLKNYNVLMFLIAPRQRPSRPQILLGNLQGRPRDSGQGGSGSEHVVPFPHRKNVGVIRCHIWNPPFLRPRKQVA